MKNGTIFISFFLLFIISQGNTQMKFSDNFISNWNMSVESEIIKIYGNDTNNILDINRVRSRWNSDKLRYNLFLKYLDEINLKNKIIKGMIVEISNSDMLDYGCYAIFQLENGDLFIINVNQYGDNGIENNIQMSTISKSPLNYDDFKNQDIYKNIESILVKGERIKSFIQDNDMLVMDGDYYILTVFDLKNMKTIITYSPQYGLDNENENWKLFISIIDEMKIFTKSILNDYIR